MDNTLNEIMRKHSSLPIEVYERQRKEVTLSMRLSAKKYMGMEVMLPTSIDLLYEN